MQASCGFATTRQKYDVIRLWTFLELRFRVPKPIILHATVRQINLNTVNAKSDINKQKYIAKEHGRINASYSPSAAILESHENTNVAENMLASRKLHYYAANVF